MVPWALVHMVVATLRRRGVMGQLLPQRTVTWSAAAVATQAITKAVSGEARLDLTRFYTSAATICQHFVHLLGILKSEQQQPTHHKSTTNYSNFFDALASLIRSITAESDDEGTVARGVRVADLTCILDKMQVVLLQVESAAGKLDEISKFINTHRKSMADNPDETIHDICAEARNLLVVHQELEEEVASLHRFVMQVW